MKLYSGKIPTIAAEMIRSLVEAQDIEVSDHNEAQLDIEAVLKEYVRLDRELTDRAKDQLESRKLSYAQFGRVKKQVAEERGLGLGDEAVSWIADQIIGCLMHSANVEEVFVEDNELRKKMAVILRRHMAVDEEVDRETRDKIKNLEEGTRTWEIEYQKVMEQIKKKRGLS